MSIRTKIIATVGPASGTAERLRQLVEGGVDVFRINFSHGTDEQRDAFLRAIRQVEQELGVPVGVAADLCGPKIRVGPIGGGGVLMSEGQQVIIQREDVEGTAERISTTLDELVDEVDEGQAILLDDGRLRLEVTQLRRPDEIVTKVVRGGVLGSGKGVNLPDTRLSVASLTEKDRRDVRFIAARDFDYVALSFVRRAEDVEQLRGLLREAGCGAHIISKIEKPQAVQAIDSIIEVSDAVMVARGDLGVEMDLARVPVEQKRIARLCQEAGKPCIIATQMLETMTHSPTPTRAEVSDVANAVLDLADAVMLSGETAVGQYPVETVRMMNGIVRQVQAYHDECSRPMPVADAGSTTAAVAGAVRALLEAKDIRAVAVFTATGATARLLAKNRLCRSILAMSPDAAAVRRMCLYYGVQPRQTEAPEHTREVLKLAEQELRKLHLAERGDRIVVVSGRPIGRPGRTNTLVVHRIGDTQD